ncbi:MAG: YceD family protein [Pseudomonadales bacterium]|nr:YceD family protein [Pseudomonadales bacterium]
MLESTLPDLIKPLKLAKRGASFSGTWPLAKFSRLTIDAFESVNVAAEGGDGKDPSKDPRVVSIQADFSIQDGIPVLVGKANSAVDFECQRCLEPVTVVLDVDLAIGFVSTEEQLALLPEPFEGVLLEEEEISVIDVVEQELILALPIVAYHDNCEAFEYRSEDEKAAQEVDRSEDENPFSVLEQLKGKLKSDD